jgi:hypothetical protein
VVAIQTFKNESPLISIFQEDLNLGVVGTKVALWMSFRATKIIKFVHGAIVMITILGKKMPFFFKSIVIFIFSA